MARAENPDELAGVIVHEIGHVTRGDRVPALRRAAGLSFLFGRLLRRLRWWRSCGCGRKTVLPSSDSHAAEAGADLCGARLAVTIGGNPRAFGANLARMAGGPGPMTKIVRDFSHAEERAAAVAMPSPGAEPSARRDGVERAALDPIRTGT